MTVGLTCKRCDQTISADDEDELIGRVQAHARDHSREHGHVPSREQILARLHRRQGEQGPPSIDHHS